MCIKFKLRRFLEKEVILVFYKLKDVYLVYDLILLVLVYVV